jgi:hypothetical protein
MVIFVTAFGITTEAVLSKKPSSLNFNLFRRIVNHAYWPIFGDIGLLESFNDESFECEDENDCPDTIDASYSFVMLMIYMIIANVLLVNVLIAMFR